MMRSTRASGGNASSSAAVRSRPGGRSSSSAMVRLEPSGYTRRRATCWAGRSMTVAATGAPRVRANMAMASRIASLAGRMPPISSRWPLTTVDPSSAT
ncbi:hypothetical protein ACWEDZ_14405 [Streptomyces sp. NPDC005047]